ncbi:MAG TPA: branched-chain amino acid ABC transporter permease [Acidimicrobiia bacterium]|jgi:branched-chain amino acid transport system permease protein
MSAEPEPKVTEAPVEDIALAGARATYRGKKLPAWVMPVIALVILGALGVLGLVTDMGMLTTLTSVLFYMVIAQGWNLLGGYGGYLNFGAAIFAGSGAYAAAWLSNEFGWSMWQTFLPAAIAAVLVSLVLGYATLRLRSHYFAIFTIVFTFLAMVIVKNTPALGGSLGLYVFLDTDLDARGLALLFYYSLFGFAVLATVVAYFVDHSNFGYALRAISEDEPAAQVLGVKTVSVKLRALVIGAAFGGVAGSVYAFQTGYIEPAGTFSLDLALDIVLVCVIGGLATWVGPMIGAVIVVVLEQWLRVFVPRLEFFGVGVPAEANRLVLGILLIVFALFIRRGIVGLFVERRGRRITV